MSKRKERREAAALYQSVSRMAQPALAGAESADDRHDLLSGHGDAPIAESILAASREFSCLVEARRDLPRELPRMKKFRFQLLHQWMTAHLEPCRVADVGGGKGLLAYLLRQSGWEATVIDPVRQALPAKYKELTTQRQVRIAETEQVPRIDRPFAPAMAQEFDLLVAVHAHGCNIQLIDAAVEFHCRLITLPCCVIGEPIVPPAGTHWLQCVVDYMVRQGFRVVPFRLNFKGQNIGLYAERAGGQFEQEQEQEQEQKHEAMPRDGRRPFQYRASEL